MPQKNMLLVQEFSAVLDRSSELGSLGVGPAAPQQRQGSGCTQPLRLLVYRPRSCCHQATKWLPQLLSKAGRRKGKEQ